MSSGTGMLDDPDAEAGPAEGTNADELRTRLRVNHDDVELKASFAARPTTPFPRHAAASPKLARPVARLPAGELGD